MNYITLQGRVEDEINRVDLSTEIQTWINEARSQIADGTLPIRQRPAQGVHRFTWLYTSTAVSTSTANNDWPTDFIEEISFLETSKEKPLVKVDPVYFDQLLYSETDNKYDLTSSGVPTNYVDRGDSYDLYPSPSSAVEIYLRYYGYPTDLSANGDEYEIDKRVPALIIYTACLIAATYMHDTQLKDHYREVVRDYYEAAVNRNKLRKWKNRNLRIKTPADFDLGHWKGLHQTGEPQ